MHTNASNDIDAGLANDLYAFSPDSGAWQQLLPLGTAPEARYGHAAASTGSFLYLAGGVSIAGARHAHAQQGSPGAQRATERPPASMHPYC